MDDNRSYAYDLVSSKANTFAEIESVNNHEFVPKKYALKFQGRGIRRFRPYESVHGLHNLRETISTFLP